MTAGMAEVIAAHRCPSFYADNDICFTYSCDLAEGHAGPHENNTDGPGIGWVD